MRGIARPRLFVGLCLLLGLSLLLAACGGGGGSSQGGGGDVEGADQLTGAGASFPDPVYQKMFQAYNKETGVQVSYDPVGSGGGREEFINGTVDFAGSDAPMSSKEEKDAGGDPQHVATVGGAIVLAYNVPDLKGQDRLNLSAQVISDIFLGKITNWNDPAIADINPDLDLPDAKITTVHRSDGSGSTDILSNFLTATNQEWSDKVGASDELDWPVGVGAEGSDGVAAQIKNTENSIGYFGLEYAKSVGNVPYANVSTSSNGPFVTPSSQTATKAIQAVEGQIPSSLKLILSSVTPDAESKDVYPITGITWLLVRAQTDDLSSCRGVAELAWYMTHDGQKYAPGLGYAKLTESLIKEDEKKIKMMKAEGEKCYMS